MENIYFGQVIEEKAKPLITFAPAWIRANAHLISDHRLTNVMWIPHCGMSDKMNAPRGRVLASNMERGVAFSVWSIHLLCQIRFALKHLVKVSAVVGPDEREEKGTMDDGLAGENQEKALGCVVEELVVGSTVKLPRREDGKKIGKRDPK